MPDYRKRLPRRTTQIALITGAFLTAAAAVEAVLSESAHKHAPQLYSKNAFRRAGAPAKYQQLLGEPTPALLERIWMVRTALTHSEPDHGRSGAKGEHMTVEGAEAAAQFVHDLGAQLGKRFLLEK